MSTTSVAAESAAESGVQTKAQKPRQQKEKKEKQPNKQAQTTTSSAKSQKQNEGVNVKKEEDFGEWFQQVITKGEMIDYYDISGCYILRPWSFQIWDYIKEFVDAEIKKLGVQNCYFPLFVSKARLETEKDHIEGFAPEVAWVTKSGEKDLDEPFAIRPTSETIIYPSFAKWIRSHRDLPMKLNQWCNVVRWEFKNPVPFLRSREFLWQEGHTAFATRHEAEQEVTDILNIYRRVYEELLAVPVTPGRKTEVEKFAGGFYTTTVEAFVPTNGRSIQAGTSHCLGQNFSKMFDIQFESESEQDKKQFAWQNSWGLSTRSLGTMVMVHSDNAGLVLPPRVAPVQVVVLAIYKKDVSTELLNQKVDEISDALKSVGLRVITDKRTDKTPGWKHNYYDLKGIPVKIEIGPMDIPKNQCVASRRDVSDKALKKTTIALAEIKTVIPALLETIQKNLFAIAKTALDKGMTRVTKWEEFVPELNKKKICLVPFCETKECEEEIKARSKKETENSLSEGEKKISGSAKSLCIPFNQPTLAPGTKCFCCSKEAKSFTLFGRSY